MESQKSIGSGWKRVVKRSNKANTKMMKIRSKSIEGYTHVPRGVVAICGDCPHLSSCMALVGYENEEWVRSSRGCSKSNCRIRMKTAAESLHWKIDTKLEGSRLSTLPRFICRPLHQ